jgi:hypothetical protein
VTKNDDPFDPGGLRIDPRDETLAQKGDERLKQRAAAAERAARRERQFIKVPLVWFDRLEATNSAATLKVALRLLQLHFRDRGRPARLGNLALGLAGVSRKQKCRALVELEGLGLVHVERSPRRSPIVTVILKPNRGRHL